MARCSAARAATGSSAAPAATSWKATPITAASSSSSWAACCSRVTAPDQINLRAPGTLLPDDATDVVRYAAGLDGVDRVLGFEAGVDVLEIALSGDTAVIEAVQGGTWVGFAAAPGGVLLVGVAGLTVGTDLVFV